MEVLKKIREYICSKENVMLAQEDIKEIYGKNFVEKIVEEEINHLCGFFDNDKSYTVPYNDFVLLSRIFDILKLNYREMGQVLAFVLNQNAKLIEGLSEEQLISQTFLANNEPIEDEKVREEVIEKFKISPSIIRKYINEDGSFNPIETNEIDIAYLKNLIFIMSKKQIETILFFCKKEYDERHKQEFVIRPKIVIEEEKDKTNPKEVKILRKKLLNYLDNSGKLIKILNEGEILDVFSILEKLKFHELEEWKKEIIKQNQKLINIKAEDERLEEEAILLEKLSEIRLECLNEHELLTYDYAMQILFDKNFAYPVIKDDIRAQINDIDELLHEILNLKEETEDADESLIQLAKWTYEKSKNDLIELMSLSFHELYEILNNYALIEKPFKLERKIDEN